MQRLQAFKFALLPTGAQEQLLRRFAGCCRYVYNRALALQKARYAAGEKRLGYVALAKELTAWRNNPSTAWLAEAPVHPQQQALKALDRAYQNFFAGRAAFPRFKKKGQGESFRVQGMTRSARGTVEAPGRNVRAKAGLNKAILDQGWGSFRVMLEYKQRWRGGEVLAVNPAFTS